MTSTAICGSDLHLYDGVIPGLLAGDILGHEFMGRVVETGPKSTLKKGERVVVPFTISCGSCFFCERRQFSACDNSNPVAKQDLSEPLYGHAMSGLFGYSHLTGGYPGGQAEYVRVPFSDVGPIVVPDGLEDEQVLFLSDILPTGWMAALNADIERGRHRGGLGLRPGRPLRRAERAPHGRRAGDRDRPLPAPAGARPRPRRRGDRLRADARCSRR